jgi:hypothetical protein
MSQNENKPSSSAELGGPVQDFLVYCEAEFERRRDSGEESDEASYKEAMDLVVRKFQALDEGKGL